MNEASQIKKCEILNIFVRHSCTLKKLVLVSDHKQLSPTVTLKEISEFVKAAGLSLMHQQILADQPYIMLNKQYQMHSHIVSIINELFYDGNLVNGATVSHHKNAQLFLEWQ